MLKIECKISEVSPFMPGKQGYVRSFNPNSQGYYMFYYGKSNGILIPKDFIVFKGDENDA